MHHVEVLSRASPPLSSPVVRSCAARECRRQDETRRVVKRLRLPAAAFLSAAAFAPMSLAQVECHAGDTVEIRTDRRSRQTSDGSSGTSNDRDTVVERVVGVRDAGVELGYDLPESVKAAARAGSWQFPARVLKTPDGRLELLNGPAMDARVDAWLTSAKLTRAACGHWIFTWNAFRIECDPQSVLPSIEALQFPSGLTDGAPYRDPAASEVAILKRTDAGPGKATFVARMAVDADAVRRSRAESDVAAAEIGGEKLSADEGASQAVGRCSVRHRYRHVRDRPGRPSATPDKAQRRDGQRSGWPVRDANGQRDRGTRPGRRSLASTQNGSDRSRKHLDLRHLHGDQLHVAAWSRT